jgi:hypothetical protein
VSKLTDLLRERFGSAAEVAKEAGRDAYPVPDEDMIRRLQRERDLKRVDRERR